MFCFCSFFLGLGESCVLRRLECCMITQQGNKGLIGELEGFPGCQVSAAELGCLEEMSTAQTCPGFPCIAAASLSRPIITSAGLQYLKSLV